MVCAPLLVKFIVDEVSVFVVKLDGKLLPVKPPVVPPIFIVPETDNVPPEVERLQVKVERSKIPVMTVRFPATEVFNPRVAVPVLFIVRLLNVVDPLPSIDCEEPVRFTVAVPEVKDPLFVQFPGTLMSKLPALNVPCDINRLPLKIAVPPSVAVPDALLIVRLL